MRALTLLLAVLAMTCCVTYCAEVDDFRFGPLSGQWSGTIEYTEDAYDWNVFIEQSNYSEPGGPFDGYQTFAKDSVLVEGPVTGAYHHPRVSLDFPVNLAPTPLLCEYRGSVDGQLHRMTGHLSCRLAGDAVVDQSMVLSKVN